ncbi:MAG: DUF4032 domain-containing protein, partial [Ilumatobacteraceae bacterium]
DLPGIHRVLGVHRHEVKLVELGDVSYVVKELPDELADREYRLLRELAEGGLPTVEVVATVTGRSEDGFPVDGLLITRHLDYSLPYRSLLSGRGLSIPFLGDRMLDALVGLLVRLHLAGFFWGDCSLSNTLFRRDAGTLSAYIIDVETGERHERLTDGQRSLDLMIATDNVAGGLLDLQEAGRLAAAIDPFTVAQTIEDRYARLWSELTGAEEFDPTGPADTHLRLRRRLDRLHGLGFDVEELDVVSSDGDPSIRIVPRVVEHGFHAERLKGLTGLVTEENQARRMLDDIREYTTELQSSTTVPVPRTWPRSAGSTAGSSRSSPRSPVICSCASRPPRSSTSSSSTAGTSRSASVTTSPSRRPCAPISTRSSRPPRTSAFTSTSRRPRSPAPSRYRDQPEDAVSAPPHPRTPHERQR